MAWVLGDYGRNRRVWRNWGRIALGEIPHVDDKQWMQQTTTMAHVHLCDKPSRSAHVPQNLKYNKKLFFTLW